MYYNLGSLLFGLCGWILPLFFMGKKRSHSTGVFLSLACSLVCGFLVLLSVRQEAFSGDFAAIEDTIHGLCLLSGSQISVALLINLLCLRKEH